MHLSSQQGKCITFELNDEAEDEAVEVISGLTNTRQYQEAITLCKNALDTMRFLNVRHSSRVDLPASTSYIQRPYVPEKLNRETPQTITSPREGC